MCVLKHSLELFRWRPWSASGMATTCYATTAMTRTTTATTATTTPTVPRDAPPPGRATRAPGAPLRRPAPTKRHRPKQGTPCRAARRRHDAELAHPQTVGLDARPTTTNQADETDATPTDALTRRRLFGLAARDADPTNKRRRTSSRDLARTPADGGERLTDATTTPRHTLQLQTTPDAHGRQGPPRQHATEDDTAPPPTTHTTTTGTLLRHTSTTTPPHQPPHRSSTRTPHPISTHTTPNATDVLPRPPYSPTTPTHMARR